MTRLLSICFTFTASSAAFAHQSSVPHVHPHEMSVLPELSVMLVAALIVACGAVALRKFGRKS
jgi:hypothetical protein